MAVGKGRATASLALAILAAVAMLGALVTDYASRAFFDSGNFANRAAVALEDDAVRAEIGERVTDDLILNAERNLIGARPVIEEVVAGVLNTGAFQSLLRATVSDVHRSIFSGDQDTLTLTIVDLGATIRGALEALNPKLARKVPGGRDIEIVQSDPPDVLIDLVQAAEEVRRLELILLVAALLLGTGAIAIAPDRRRALLRLGLAVAACGVVGAVAYGVGRRSHLTPSAKPGRGMPRPESGTPTSATCGRRCWCSRGSERSLRRRPPRCFAPSIWERRLAKRGSWSRPCPRPPQAGRCAGCCCWSAASS
jgi:hypothetical protein